MKEFRFSKELYSRQALLKAAYNFTDRAYLHLDADEKYFLVFLTDRDGNNISENDFINEMLAQTVRHEIYLQTKNIRELLLARALATSVVIEENDDTFVDSVPGEGNDFDENEILKDWFASHD